MLIDTHAHLTSPQVVSDVDAVLARAKAAGVTKIVNICTDVDSLNLGLELAKKYDWVFNTAATTPHDVEKEGELFFPFVESAARDKKLIAIGETGLDYFYEHSSKEVQKNFLNRYFTLALAADLPLVIHCRDAFKDLFDEADRGYKEAPAILHCFTGSLEEAKGVLDRGWYVSFSGIVTYKKSESLRAVARFVPLDRIVIETDTPYLAPQSYRGKQNEPAFVVETAEVLSLEKNISLEKLKEITAENACKIFPF
ncbi:MAG: TatD family hydrolase [Chlamydiota bacterium]